MEGKELTYWGADQLRAELRVELGEVMREIRDAGETGELATKRDSLRERIAHCSAVLKAKAGKGKVRAPRKAKEEEPDRSEWV